MKDNLLSELKEETIDEYNQALEGEKNARIHADNMRQKLLEEAGSLLKKASSEEFKKFLNLQCHFAEEGGESSSEVSQFLANLYLFNTGILGIERKKIFFVEIVDFEKEFGKMEFKEILDFLENELKVLFKKMSFSVLSTPVIPHGGNEHTDYKFYLTSEGRMMDL